MNELQLETSPYLLQHANNPIYWKSWSNDILSLAKKENKLIIISIGYSACHWCHVMEKESFEDEEVAAVMNNHFISIKIDREERPDVDAVYMKAVQIMTGRGGWPMNVVCLPDGRPVWGGTYFRKEEWINYLEQLQKMYQQEPEKLYLYAEKMIEGLNALHTLEAKNSEFHFDIDTINLLIEKWQKSFDWEYGGMARAPKFMTPTNYNFLLRLGFQTKNQTLIDFVNLTLTKMAYGGLFDTVDGGFSRYSVDIKWHVPHFEKMLYDNGQLVSLYANAYLFAPNELYKDCIEKTLRFVEKEWLNQEGSFFSALDADSLNENHILEEGAFYVWTKEELKTIIKEDFELFCTVFNCNSFGLWEQDKYVLIQNDTIEKIAFREGLSPQALKNKKTLWEQQLYLAREKRNKPRLDDKCICSWNAIMLKGYLDAYKALGNERYMQIALQNAHFILTHFWSKEGNLFHSYKNGVAKINGYLEDYCFVIEAFIALYQITYDESWLQNAKQLTDYCLDHFYDKSSAFLSFTSNIDQPLINAHYEIEDSVIPSSNSVMANNLFLLSIYYNNTHYENIAKKMITVILPNIDYPSAFSNWLNVYFHFSSQNKELAICGKDAKKYGKQLLGSYHPNLVIAATDKDSQLPFLKNRFSSNETLFFLCQNKTCGLPISSFQEVNKNLIL